MIKKSHSAWKNIEKNALWILYHSNIPTNLIAGILERSERSISKAITRFKIITNSRSKNRGIKMYRDQYTQQRTLEILTSVLIKPELGFTENNINWMKMPQRVPPWQKKSTQRILHKKTTSQAQEKRNKVASNSISLEGLSERLKAHGCEVLQLTHKCSYRKLPLYYIDGKLKTPQQMLMLLNKLRFTQGKKEPLLLQGYTY